MTFRQRMILFGLIGVAVIISTLEHLMLPATPLDAGKAVVVSGPLYLSSPTPTEAGLSSLKFSWRSLIYIGGPTARHQVRCMPIPEACTELLRHQQSDLSIALIAVPELFNPGGAQAWMLSAHSDGQPIVQPSTQNEAYARYRRLQLRTLAFIYLVFLGAGIYAFRKTGRI